MFTAAMDLVLSDVERADLERALRQATLAQAIAKRIRVVLALGDGVTYAAINAALACTDRFSAIWKRRCVEGGILALADTPRAGRGHGLSAAMEEKIVRVTVHTKPPVPVTHWSSRRLAKRLGLAHTTVADVWKRHGLQPLRLER